MDRNTNWRRHDRETDRRTKKGGLKKKDKWKTKINTEVKTQTPKLFLDFVGMDYLGPGLAKTRFFPVSDLKAKLS